MKTTWQTTQKITVIIICCTSLLAAQPDAEFGRLSVTGLRCENARDPVGVDQMAPSFEWQLQSKRRCVNQSAYQIRVVSSLERLKTGTIDLWDSGRVSSDQAYMIVYGGRPLQSSHRYYWTVRLWDQTGETTNWSQPATFVTGLLSGNDWQAKWITANRNEKDIVETKKIHRESKNKLFYCLLRACLISL